MHRSNIAQTHATFLSFFKIFSRLLLKLLLPWSIKYVIEMAEYRCLGSLYEDANNCDCDLEYDIRDGRILLLLLHERLWLCPKYVRAVKGHLGSRDASHCLLLPTRRIRSDITCHFQLGNATTSTLYCEELIIQS